MKKILYTILASFLAFSCSDEKHNTPKQDNPLFSTSRAVTLNKLDGRINLEEIGIYNPTKVIKKDSLFIVLDQEGLNKISIYNEKGKVLGSYLPVGMGADRGLYILTMNLDTKGMLTAYDYGNDRLVEFDMNQFGQPGFGPKFIDMPKDKKHLCVSKYGSTIISTGVFTDGRYALMDDGKEEFFLDFPKIPTYRSVSDTLMSALFASNIIKIKPDGTKFVCANMLSGIIDFCSLIPCNITRITELNLYSPKATLKSRRNPVAYSAGNLYGFRDVEVSDDYIFALYSGRSYQQYKDLMIYGERIVVFDWEGNHVRTYLLRDPFTSISYNKEENAIYGLTNNPNSVLIKHTLD
ncbi:MULTISPECIES: BF3164 family lipoprotein [Odoribacteraceae]|uniref:BF3164 family lipoprotein n=1 Tax=Odoribacteraceae TaxID=1853231 RepID=UPI000E5009A5|nr:MULTISPECIES: BF3164 family lipoprotein [Odoribacteraceae]MCQ4874334.1 TolB-like 6-bladed beta-propeller domain-containing protein [Butyricimonas paravirosa]RHR77178.1 hypothetical protein DWW52_14740 [Odoribacter sp. AF15-53]